MPQMSRPNDDTMVSAVGSSTGFHPSIKSWTIGRWQLDMSSHSDISQRMGGSRHRRAKRSNAKSPAARRAVRHWSRRANGTRTTAATAVHHCHAAHVPPKRNDTHARRTTRRGKTSTCRAKIATVSGRVGSDPPRDGRSVDGGSAMSTCVTCDDGCITGRAWRQRPCDQVQAPGGLVQACRALRPPDS